jgi:hypothetical protein
MSGPPDLLSRFQSLASVSVAVVAAISKAVAFLIVPIVAGAAVTAATNILGGLLVWLCFSLVGLAAIGLQEYPLTTLGMEHRVDEDLFVGEHEQCAECGLSIDRGQRRQFAEQYVVFGYPLYTTDWGENVYCPWCADGLESPAADRQPTASDTRQRESTPADPARAHEKTP